MGFPTRFATYPTLCRVCHKERKIQKFDRDPPLALISISPLARLRGYEIEVEK